MTFAPKCCRRLDSQTPVGNTAGQATTPQISKFVYATQDAAAAVEAAGYFNPLRDAGGLTVGCQISASMVLGGVPVLKNYVVLTAPATGNVTIGVAS